MKWAKDNLDGYLNLFSIAGDGRVTNWTIVKTALWYTDTLSITFTQILQNLSKEDTKDNLKGNEVFDFEVSLFLNTDTNANLYSTFIFQHKNI